MGALVANGTFWIDLLGTSLLHFLWQGIVVGAVYRLLRPLCTTVSARYGLGLASLFVMLVSPVATLVWLDAGSRAHAEHMSSASAAMSAVSDAAASIMPTSGLSGLSWHQALPWFVACWIIGVCAIAARSFLHWRRLIRIVKQAAPMSRDWQLRLIDLRMRFGVMTSVQLFSSIHVSTPTLIGWLKPAILLPASLITGFTAAQIELILAHELSHIRRLDYLANLYQVIVETLLFYHPVVHWISRDVRQAREQCCDDLVLSLGRGDAMAYARMLADLEELHHDFGTAVPALGIGGGVLMTRIRRIVDPLQASAGGPLAGGNGVALPVVMAFAGLMLAAVLRLQTTPSSVISAVVVQSTKSGMDFLGVRATLTVPNLVVAAEPFHPVVPANGSIDLLPASGNDSAYISVDPPARPHIASSASLPGVSVSNLPLKIEQPESPTLTRPAATNAAADEAPAIGLAVAMRLVATKVVQPSYPIDALQAGVTGRVELDFRIGGDGSVRDIRVLGAEPSGVFEQSAIAALRQWQFQPNAAASTTRYARTFAFARADSKVEGCREVTGSHICRHGIGESDEN